MVAADQTNHARDLGENIDFDAEAMREEAEGCKEVVHEDADSDGETSLFWDETVKEGQGQTGAGTAPKNGNGKADDIVELTFLQNTNGKSQGASAASSSTEDGSAVKAGLKHKAVSNGADFTSPPPKAARTHLLVPSSSATPIKVMDKAPSKGKKPADGAVMLAKKQITLRF